MDRQLVEEVNGHHFFEDDGTLRCGLCTRWARAACSRRLLRCSHCAGVPVRWRHEYYVMRHEWGVPSDSTLQKHHRLTCQPFWKFLLRKVGVPVSDSATFASVRSLLHDRWLDFLELTSWWEFKRYFNRNGNTVVLKPKTDLIVVHPAGRFAKARTDQQWQEAFPKAIKLGEPWCEEQSQQRRSQPQECCEKHKTDAYIEHE